MEDTSILHNPTDGWETTHDPSDMNTTNASEEPLSVSEDVLFLRQIAKGMDFWVPPFLFLVGTSSNTLVVLVMWSRHFRHISTSLYMGVSAIVDTISLIIPLPVHWLYVNFPYLFDDIRHLHFICAICHPAGWISSNLGVFLTVAMTVDRSLAIQFPLKAPTLCTVRRAKVVTVWLLVLELLLEGHVGFTTRVVPKEITAYLCAVDKSFSKAYRVFHDTYWPNIHNVLLLLSFVTIMVGNVIITLHVKRSEDSKNIGEGAKSVGGGTQSGKTSSSSSSSKFRQLSLMLIVDSISIISCTMPYTIYTIVDHEAFMSNQTFEDNPLEEAKRGMIFAITFYLMYLNHCVNFFLYCLSGSRFRKALTDVLLLSGKASQRDSDGSWTSAKTGSVHAKK